MDIVDMRHAIMRYCEDTSCSECVLNSEEHCWKTNSPMANEHCLSITMSDNEDLEKAYRLITGVTDKASAVNHPAHYADGKIEVIDFIEDKNLNFNRGNAVKYIARAGKKDPTKEAEDLEKAIWYLEHELQRIKGDR